MCFRFDDAAFAAPPRVRLTSSAATIAACLAVARRQRPSLALQRAGVLSALGHTWMGEIADVAADAIAGRLVPLSKFDEAVRTLEALLDACPYLVAEKGGSA